MNIPSEAIAGLQRLGFQFSHGYIHIKRDGLFTQKEYVMKHRTEPVFLLQSYSSTWFFNSHSFRWIHPDGIHEYMEQLDKK